jgi:hypothetical protein
MKLSISYARGLFCALAVCLNMTALCVQADHGWNSGWRMVDMFAVACCGVAVAFQVLGAVQHLLHDTHNKGEVFYVMTLLPESAQLRGTPAWFP